MKDERLKQVLLSIAFLRSVILSGEPMTEEVRNIINDSIDNIKDVDKSLQVLKSEQVTKEIKPPEPPKDREVHLGGQSRHKDK